MFSSPFSVQIPSKGAVPGCLDPRQSASLQDIRQIVTAGQGRTPRPPRGKANWRVLP